MKAINPNDLFKLDKDSISFITLKDGNMIMIDESAPEKFISNNPNKITNSSQKNNSSQKLTVSKRLTFSYKGENIPNNLYNEKINSRYNDIYEQKILKNDFNLISKISKNTNFEFKPKIPNKNKINDINTFQLNENYNINNNINPKTNVNVNTSKNTLINLDENNNNNMTEEEKIDLRIRRKSRNYLERLNLAFGEKNKQLINAVISLKIPSDINRQFNATQKEFNSMVAQLKSKRSKYRTEENQKSIYRKNYELYKDDNNKILSNLKFSKLKHYEEAAADDIENEQLLHKKELLGKNKFKNYNLNNNNFNDTISLLNLKGINKSIIFGTNDSFRSSNSLYGNKTGFSNDSRSLSSRFGGNNIGYSSTLICPSNIFKIKTKE